ncbi:MAG: tetratricopeptide repeat protein [Proteobacteria bacterium]|nr:tetratricopeptide repeat protein [Pseudomonadota bacterium]
MQKRPMRFGLLAVAIVAAGALPTLALAQDDQVQQTDRHEVVKKREPKVVPLFPQATRAEPPNKASSDAMAKNVNKLHDLIGAHQDDDAIALANTMLADPKANAFDKSAAWQSIGYANFGKHDAAKAAEALKNAIDANGLPNNDHYQAMFNLAVAQSSAGQPDAALATLDRLSKETREDKPAYNGIRGRDFFMKKDYANAASALEKALAGEAKPDPNEQQMLFASYFELKQGDKAIALGESLHKANPDDKGALMNLASAYMAAKQTDKAKALLADARARGMLTTSDDYRKLIQIYANTPGADAQTIALINEGLQKNVLKPDAAIYSVLAQSYVAQGQNEQAIDAYKKADAVSSDGEAGLNLARMYNNAQQHAQARAAAQAAIAKGLSAADQQAAQKLIAANGAASPPPRKKK